MHVTNRLLHELDLKAHGSIVDLAKQAEICFPHIYAALRNEKSISVGHLERLGDVLGMELVWRKKAQDKKVTLEGKMETGVYIRAKVGSKFESIDIGDERLPAPELLRWLGTLPDDAILRTVDKAKELIAAADKEAVFRARKRV